MKKHIPIDKIITRGFGSDMPIAKNPYVEYSKEFLFEAIPPEDSGYYKYLLNLLTAHGNVWNYIKTPEDALKRATYFRDLCESISEDGYKEYGEIEFKTKEIAFGWMTSNKLEDGTYWLRDGLHRASILIALGHKELYIDEVNYSYQDMYKPKEKLKHLIAAKGFDWSGKTYLEIGCNIGAMGKFVLEHGAKYYEGYDHIKEYIDEGLSRWPHLNLEVAQAHTIQTTQHFDVFLALGVFHHMTEEHIALVFENISAEWVIFENPLGDKPWPPYPYRMRTREFYFQFLEQDTIKEFDWGFPYQKERKIFVAKKKIQAI